MHYDLTSTQKEFLKILNCFIHAKSCDVSEDFLAFDELYQMAAIHRVTAAVFDTICQSERVCKVMEQDLFARWKVHSIREVSHQTQKTCAFLDLYQQMAAAGLRPLVVKGLIRRQMYDKPDSCSSSDEDLLIHREEFPRYDAFLLQQGFRRTQWDARRDDAEESILDITNLPMEVGYYHPKTAVYLEVHMALFPAELGAYGDLNADFATAFATAISEKVQGVLVWTLNPTLHMWYLICHSLKHFLHSGFGLRQICDMIKMSEYYGAQIDWTWIAGRIRELRLALYWGGIVDIAVKHLGCKPEVLFRDICPVAVDGTDFLLDLFDSGIYGSSSLARRQSSNMTLAASKRGKKATMFSLWRSLFPGQDYMKKKYSYLQKCPWMLPIAWGQRMKGYVKAQKNRKNHKSIQIGMQRVELLKQYGLIEE